MCFIRHRLPESKDWHESVCTADFPGIVTGDFSICAATLTSRKNNLLAWIQVIENHFPIKPVLDTDHKYYWKITQPMPKHLFHFMIILLRQPVEDAYGKERAFPVNPLNFGLESDDPLIKFMKATQDEQFDRSGVHGLKVMLAWMTDRGCSISDLRLQTAIDDLKTSPWGINDAWIKYIRIGLSTR